MRRRWDEGHHHLLQRPGRVGNDDPDRRAAGFPGVRLAQQDRPST